MADNSKASIIITAVDQTKEAIASAKEGLGSLTESASTLNESLAVLAPLIGAASFTEMIKGSIEGADALDLMSKRTGMAVDQLAAWKLLSEQSGVGLDDLANALAKASKYMVTHSENLKALGIQANNAEEVILQLSGVIEKLPADDPRRAAVAMEVLGKGAAALLPLLSEGEAGLRKLLDAGKDLNQVTPEMAEHAHEFNDQMDIFKQRMHAGADILTEEMLPALTRFMETMNGTKPPSELASELFQTLADASGKLNEMQKDQKAGGFGGLFITDEDITLQKQYIDKIKAQLTTAVSDSQKEMAAAANKEGGGKSTSQLQNAIDGISKPKVAFDETLAGAQLADYNEEMSRILAQQGKEFEAVTKQANAYRTFQDALDGVSGIEKSRSQGMQETLDKYIELDTQGRDYLQNIIDQTRAVEALVALEAAENQGIDNQIDAESRLADAEKTAADDRDKIYAQMSEQMQQTNEDLNASLLRSDEQRGKAQIELERQRAEDNINSLGLEGEQAQELIDKNNEAAQLKLKQLNATITDSNGFMKSLGATFESSFEKAITGGQKASDIFKGLLQDMIRLATQKFVLDPLMKQFDSAIGNFNIGNLFGGGSAVGGANFMDGVSIGGDAAGFLPGFAVGTPYVPQDMVAQIHQGERVMTAAENRTYSAGGNSPVINVSVDAGSSSVQGDAGASGNLAAKIGAAVRSVLVDEKRPGGLLAGVPA